MQTVFSQACVPLPQAFADAAACNIFSAAADAALDVDVPARQQEVRTPYDAGTASSAALLRQQLLPAPAPHPNLARSRRGEPGPTCSHNVLRKECAFCGCSWFSRDAYEVQSFYALLTPLLYCDNLVVATPGRNALECNFPRPCHGNISLWLNFDDSDGSSPAFEIRRANALAIAEFFGENVLYAAVLRPPPAQHVKTLPPPSFDSEVLLTTLLQKMSNVSMVFAGFLGLKTVPTAALQPIADRLTFLDLSRNDIMSLDSTSFKAMTSLRALYLIGNQITAIANDTFATATAVVSLHLTLNGLKELSGGYLQPLAQLQAAYLEQNDISSISPTFFASQSALTWLSLGENKLGAVPLEGLLPLVNLRSLFLEDNAIKDLPPLPANFSRLAAWDFDTISLADNELTVLSRDWIAALHGSVKNLNVNRNRFTKLDFAGIEGLARLSVADNLLTMIVLAQDIQLSSLDVSGNADLTQISCTNASGEFRTVSHLDVSGTRVAFEDVYTCFDVQESLYTQHLAHWSASQVLRTYLNPATAIANIDISFIGDIGNIGAIETSVADSSFFLDTSGRGGLFAERGTRCLSTTPVYYFDSDHEWYRPIAPLPALLMSQEKSECSFALQTSGDTRVLLFCPTASGFAPLSEAPLAQLHCRCAPGYDEHDGICYPSTAWYRDKRYQATLGFITSLLVLALFALAIRRYYRRARVAQKDLLLNQHLLADAEWQMMELKAAWRIDAAEVHLHQRIDGSSQGAFGAVWRGDWDGLTVAIKVLREGMLDMDEALAREFEKEAEFLMRARHANLVRFFGVGEMPTGEPFLVLELVARGSLRALLATDSDQSRLGAPPPLQPLSTQAKHRIACDVAAGMAHIHSMHALHRDLKSGNVLITENWRAKVADFGSIGELPMGHDLERGTPRREATFFVFYLTALLPRGGPPPPTPFSFTRDNYPSK
jgi:hypothetical protein